MKLKIALIACLGLTSPNAADAPHLSLTSQRASAIAEATKSAKATTPVSARDIASLNLTRHASPFETIVAQPNIAAGSAQIMGELQASSIDPLKEIKDTIELSKRFEWRNKLLSLGICYDSEWETMNSHQLQVLHSVHRTVLAMTEALSSLRF